MKNLFSIKNKVIIITGAGSGIGESITLNFAKNFAHVYAIDINFNKKSPKKVNRINQIKCDISNKEEFRKISENIFKKHNKIDVLINNAGVSHAARRKEKEYSKKNWDETINVNLTSSFFCSQIVSKYMKKKKTGSIINITSVAAEIAFSRNPAYVSSKGGLKMLGKALAKDLGKNGIRVNNIGPGFIKTNMTKLDFMNNKIKEKITNQIMLGRLGEKEDLIGACIFFCSDASNYITGQDIYVDGGWVSNNGLL